MVVVEVQHMGAMWILLVPLGAYVRKLSALAPSRLEFFSALDVCMTRHSGRSRISAGYLRGFEISILKHLTRVNAGFG